jgi:hypothetical protein
VKRSSSWREEIDVDWEGFDSVQLGDSKERQHSGLHPQFGEENAMSKSGAERA